MKFGSVDNPENIDFKLPPDPPETLQILGTNGSNKLDVRVGCAKWNKQDLKGFYPRGTKDELSYYATQFNSIELNSTFYTMPPRQQIVTWRNKTSDDFKFFPKINGTISHYKRLKGAEMLVDEFCTNMSAFESNLGMVFLQMHDNFKPRNFKILMQFIQDFPSGIPFALELRNKEWFGDSGISKELHNFMRQQNVTNIIVDTAGRRDMLHMSLTTPTAFIRFVGANHESDYKRLDGWVNRAEKWVSMGLQNLYFFIHQNIEKESPLLSAYFITKINGRLGLNLKVPEMPR
jgi:uncharacterized protein YecE (DUF72 family)